MPEIHIYQDISIAVAEDFYTKALASGFSVDGAAPTSFTALAMFNLVYKDAVEFAIDYDAYEQTVTLSIVRKSFPYNLVPDTVIFSQISGYLAEAKSKTLKPNMVVWSNARHQNELQWGGFARPYFHRRKKHEADGSIRFNLSEISYTVPQVGKMYSFPAGDGAGETIGLVELGGGFLPAILDKYVPGLAARTKILSVGGGLNSPGQPADGEVYLDIEVPGALLAKANITVAFAPNTEQGFVDAVNGLAKTCTRISISWGAREDDWTPMGMMALNQAIADAAIKGITVTVAQGDNAFTDGGRGAGVDFPGSSPYAISCGGTAAHHSFLGKLQETVWYHEEDGSGTGGGISTQFPLPVYQQYLTVTDTTGKTYNPKFRFVPDVSGVADPATGYVILMPDGPEVIGGTSAVAPLWAALMALIGSKSDVHSAIYGLRTQELRSTCFNENITGSNGEWVATPGKPSAAVGFGTPIGAALKALFAGK